MFQADDLSDDLYNFQLAVNHVQDAEEVALDEHNRYLEVTLHFTFVLVYNFS